MTESRTLVSDEETLPEAPAAPAWPPHREIGASLLKGTDPVYTTLVAYLEGQRAMFTALEAMSKVWQRGHAVIQAFRMDTLAATASGVESWVAFEGEYPYQEGGSWGSPYAWGGSKAEALANLARYLEDPIAFDEWKADLVTSTASAMRRQEGLTVRICRGCGLHHAMKAETAPAKLEACEACP